VAHDKKPSRQPTYKRLWEWTGFGNKPLWEYLTLLAALGAVSVSAATAAFTVESQRQITAEQTQTDDLQTYIDQIVTLFADSEYVRHAPKDEVQALAHARTLIALEHADLPRKKSLMKFLYNARLIQGDHPAINLDGADLTNVDLTQVDLSGANLSGATLNAANLTGAHLTHATVSEKQLDKVKSLKGATMPNGQKYEEWLKSRGQENSGCP
jgi:hypothetical protein